MDLPDSEEFILNLEFIPIIVGTDMNAYNMSISFHEEYGVHPILVGQAPLTFTRYSTIPAHIEYFADLHEAGKFTINLEKVAKKYQEPNKKLLLVGTNDMYVRYIVENAEFLRQYYVFNYPSLKVIDQLQYKANFYQLCEEYGIDYPTTRFYNCGDISEAFHDEKMRYPVVLKPSNVIKYIDLHFPGKKKVYRVDSEKEVNEVIKTLHDGHYDDDVIIQEFIPGDDSYMWDGVLYVNQDKKVQLVALGQVVLQEHTPTAIGNYTAIMARFNQDLMDMMKNFLEEIGYTGFANFDLKYDERDGKFKVFEINIRQGRSSYYVTRLGENMARYLVDDCVYHQDKPIKYAQGEYLFSVVPKKVLREHVENPDIQKEVQSLIQANKWGNPLFYKKDKSFKRKLYLVARQINYVKKYRNNHW